MPILDTIRRLVYVGASVRVDARFTTPDGLRDLALLARGGASMSGHERTGAPIGGGIVTIANAGDVPDEYLGLIASAGMAHVAFDFAS